MNTIDKNALNPQELENASGGFLHGSRYYTDELRKTYIEETGAFHTGCNGKILLHVTAGKREYRCNKCGEMHPVLENFASFTPVPPVMPKN